MFRLLNVIEGARTSRGRRALGWLILIGVLFLLGSLIYSVVKPTPKYTPPSGQYVAVVCNTGGNDCDENGFVRLWTDPFRAKSSFVRSPDALDCIATKSTVSNGEEFWWIDCGLWQGNELPIIEGWVSENDLKFFGATNP